MFRDLLRRRPAPGTIMGGLALFITLGGVGYAATGGTFILGQANTATTPSSLSAPVAGKTLQLTNTSTGTGATALGLTVASGKAPFSVNSTGKVTNLNADRLDGLDSTSFLRTTGKAADADKLDGLDSSEFSGVGGLATTTSFDMPDCNPGLNYLVRSFTAPRDGWALVNASFTAGIGNIGPTPVAARIEHTIDTSPSPVVGVWQEETLATNGRGNISLSQASFVVAGNNNFILKVCDNSDSIGAHTIEGQLTILYTPFGF